MKRSVIVMSSKEGGVECETAGGLVFEPGGAPPVAAADCWRGPEAGPESEGAGAGCAVEPVGAGVSPTLGSIMQGTKGCDNGEKVQREGSLGNFS